MEKIVIPRLSKSRTLALNLQKTKNGKTVRFFWDEENGFRADENGNSAIWNIVLSFWVILLKKI